MSGVRPPTDCNERMSQLAGEEQPRKSAKSECAGQTD